MIGWGRACLASTHDFAEALASDAVNDSFMTSQAAAQLPGGR
jgi:hypothetical protein